MRILHYFSFSSISFLLSFAFYFAFVTTIKAQKKLLAFEYKLLEGELINGKKEGPWLLLHQNKQIKLAVDFRDGKMNGFLNRYDTSGALLLKAAYLHDTLHGAFNAYHQGKLIEHGYYQRGIPLGEWTQYYENGACMSKRIYEDTAGNGSYVFYHLNGRIGSEGNFKNRQMHGLWQSYHDNGSLYTKVRYEQGRRTGVIQLFYSGSALMSVGHYKNDKIDGKWQSFYQNGLVEQSGFYERGLKTGVWELFHYNGLPHRKLVYRQGLLLELSECADQYGTTIDCGDLKNGNGTVIWFDSTGSISRTDYYEDGTFSSIK